MIYVLVGSYGIIGTLFAIFLGVVIQNQYLTSFFWVWVVFDYFYSMKPGLTSFFLGRQLILVWDLKLAENILSEEKNRQGAFGS